MDKYTARCEDCRYVLFNRGQIGTETFGTKHAIKSRHKVIINGPYGSTVINNRARLEPLPNDRAPF